MSRIGVLEDSDDIRDLLVSILEGRGHEVQAWGTIADARAWIPAFAPELLILDIDLPDGCGLDVARTRDAEGRPIPAIMLSSHGRETDIVRGFVAGAVDYVTKPFLQDELLARIAVRLAKANPHAAPANLPGVDLPETAGLAFGRYRVERLLGHGGYGEVFLALDTQGEDRPVALKVLAPLAGEQVEARIRFIRESYAAARIDHPRVAGVRDVGAAQGRLYYAMDYVQGPTLHARIEEGEPLSEAELRGLARGLLEGAAALEAVGIVHRDIKPENVVLRGGSASEPVLVDFGLAKLPFDRGVTHADFIMGTPAFLPPEVVLGDPADHRGDLYQVGLTLRFALLRDLPFPELNGLALLNTIARTPVPPVPAATTPGWLQALLGALLAHAPADRPKSARSLLASLGL